MPAYPHRMAKVGLFLGAAAWAGLSGAPGCGEGGGSGGRDATDGDAPGDAWLGETSDTTSDLPPIPDAAADGEADGKVDAGTGVPSALLLSVPEVESWTFEELSGPVHVLRTEGNVPHIYAANRTDLAFVLGFVQARDRYFMMELARRLGLGTVAALLGEAALETDLQTRAVGQRAVAERTAATLPPELGAVFDAFASGINAYIAKVQAKELPPPTELALAGPLLGADDPAQLMEPFDRLSIAGIIAVVQYEASFETGDVGATAVVQQLAALYAGDAPHAELRQQGALADIWSTIRPLFPIASAPSWMERQGRKPFPAPPLPAAAPVSPALAPLMRESGVPLEVIQRLADRLERYGGRFRRDPEEGFGSNAWGVSASAAAHGRSLIAGDGHLSLSVPSFLWQLGLDTSVLGGGDLHQLGLTVPGLPMMGLGTNGHVAWSHTQQSPDITDWYREELRLDEQGRPDASWYQGRWHPLTAVDEQYEVADIPLLGSEGKVVSVTRWMTFDGRWLVEIEGLSASAETAPGPGEVVVNLGGDLVIPKDTSGDGKVTAISFDYTGFDSTGFAAAIDAMGHATSVTAFAEAMRGLNAYSQNFVAADQAGDIYYSGFQGLPCRASLPRDATGAWVAGADPRYLLDGTQYGAFEIPMVDGKVDAETSSADRCAISPAEYPHETSPPQGYLVNANNDPAGFAFDDDVTNDPLYLGDGWDGGIRAHAISKELEAAIASGEATLERMQELQAHHRSRLGAWFAPYLALAIERARTLALAADAPQQSPWQARLAALYAARADAFDEVAERLGGWAQRGYLAASGVETFYSSPSPSDVEDAVATMLFNAFIGRAMQRVFDDEGLPGIFRPRSSDAKVRTLLWMLESRGPDNPRGLHSWLAETEESIFFDVLSTPELERSDEVLLLALGDALEFLASAPQVAGTGGFGTSDMAGWRWGLRHQAKFESILADFLDASSEYSFIVELFAIDTSVIPLAEGIPPGDPRAALRWFPRHGDQEAVDAGNPGFSGTQFSHGSGPVMRMVIELGGGEVKGANIVPGGQSGLTDSPHFSDQLELWLGNSALPMRFSLEDAVAGARGREVYGPR